MTVTPLPGQRATATIESAATSGNTEHHQPQKSSASSNRPSSASATNATPPITARRPTSSPQQAPRIGPYVLGKTLGVGSTGRVKLGTHVETGMRVAIKIISKEALATGKDGQPVSSEKKEQINKKLEREITIMKLIQHPHVMQLHDVYETDKELFLVLEHVEGGELFDYLVKRGRLPEKEAVDFFQQIILGVDFCHRHLVAHRDLKPENLLLDKDMNIKIADFGMASLQVTGKMLETSCGSPHYASPEIIKGIKYDGGPADIWSCGVILYALLTGNLPFDDENIRRLLSKVKQGVYHIPDYVSNEGRDLIKRMLIVEPTKRIDMKGILEHPWFRLRASKTSRLQAALDDPEKVKPVDPSLLDRDVIQSLTLLGWGTELEIEASMMQEKPTIEKVFYHLLYRRKCDSLENYDVYARPDLYEQIDGPRRRTSSFASLYTAGSKTDVFRSNENIIRQRSGGELHSRQVSNSSSNDSSPVQKAVSNDSFDVGSSPPRHDIPLKPSSSTSSPTPLNQKKMSIITAPRINSPLSKSTILDEAEVASPSGISEVSSPADTNTSSPTTPERGRARPNLKVAIPPSVLPVTATNGNAPILDERLASQKSPMMEKLQNLSIGSPRFHRKKPDLTAMPSPVISSAPKRSWFANMFNFKPESFVFYTSRNYDETMNWLEQTFKAFDVMMQPRKEGGFKCKYETNAQFSPTAAESNNVPTSESPAGGSSSSSSSPSNNISPSSEKVVKFKAELSFDETDPSKLKVTLVHQQGSYAVLQSLAERLASKWQG